MSTPLGRPPSVEDPESDPLVTLCSIGNMIEATSKLESEQDRREQAFTISRALNLVFAQEIPLHLNVIAEALGLSPAIQRVRGGIRLQFRKVLAQKLRVQKTAVLDIKTPQTVTVLKKKIEEIREIMVPPDSGSILPGSGEADFEKKHLIRRKELILELLQEMKIQDTTLLEGTVDDHMFRKTPYCCFVICEIERLILVCEEEGNQTFVVDTSKNPEKSPKNWYMKTKSQLKECQEVRELRWTSDEAAWKTELKELLLNKEIEVKGKKLFPMHREYFFNPGYVKYDLLAYARALGEGKSVADLNTHVIQSLKIICCNGEHVTGNTWLRRAGVALGVAKNTAEAQKHRAEILERLLEVAGFIVMNEQYFSNPEHVKYDLLAYATVLGQGKSVADLNTKNMQSLKIICCNGEQMKGRTWLRRAGVALSVAKDQTEAGKHSAAILRRFREQLLS